MSTGQPVDLVEGWVVPSRSLQPHKFIERGRGFVRRTTSQLVSLHTRREILHQQHKQASAVIDIREVATGRPDTHSLGDFSVEPDLAHIRSAPGCGSAADLVVRWELSDNRRRLSELFVPLEGASCIFPHLPGADGFGLKRDDRCSSGNTAGLEDFSEPLLSDVER